VSFTMRKTGDWGKVARVLSSHDRLPNAVRKAAEGEAQALRAEVTKGLDSQAPGGRSLAPVERTTAAVRRAKGLGSGRSLLVTGDLQAAVTVQRSGDGVFVGVPRTARGRQGQPLGAIASQAERGGYIVLRKTPKMMAFLHRAFREAGLPAPPKGIKASSKGAIIIRIKPRPFLKPVVERYLASPAAAEKRIAEQLARAMGL
jgi:hypothetical protein